MGSRRSREFRRMDENEWTWRRLKSDTRLAVDDVNASGIGRRRLQLLLLPSFDDPMAFEMHRAESEWRLFSSQVCETYPVPRLLGYEHVLSIRRSWPPIFRKSSRCLSHSLRTSTMDAVSTAPVVISLCSAICILNGALCGGRIRLRNGSRWWTWRTKCLMHLRRSRTRMPNLICSRISRRLS